MSEGNYNNRLSKFIAAQKPNRLKVDDVAKANANTTKLCDCPGSEPGKINLDIYAHLSGCWIRKRLQSGRFIVNTSVLPRRINDGYGLGVAIRAEDF